jgi:hypothetical protein
MRGVAVGYIPEVDFQGRRMSESVDVARANRYSWANLQAVFSGLRNERDCGHREGMDVALSAVGETIVAMGELPCALDAF